MSLPTSSCSGNPSSTAPSKCSGSFSRRNERSASCSAGTQRSAREAGCVRGGGEDELAEPRAGRPLRRRPARGERARDAGREGVRQGEVLVLVRQHEERAASVGEERRRCFDGVEGAELGRSKRRAGRGGGRRRRKQAGVEGMAALQEHHRAAGFGGFGRLAWGIENFRATGDWGAARNDAMDFLRATSTWADCCNMGLNKYSALVNGGQLEGLGPFGSHENQRKRNVDIREQVGRIYQWPRVL
ncbi:hypothetical protein EJB05_15070, partial [Eragrostis curvula]